MTNRTLLLLLTVGFGCKSAASPAPRGVHTNASRNAFNAGAVFLDVPVYWYADDDGTIDRSEVVFLAGVDAKPEDWLTDDGFTERFHAAFGRIEAGLAAPKDPRLAAVHRELSQSRATLVRTDLRDAPAEDKAFVRDMLAAGALIERLFARQNGVLSMASKIGEDDAASRRLFHRNQGPWCAAPDTENVEACTAITPKPEKISGLYPESLQKNDPKFCETLAARDDAAKLMHQFHAVREVDGALVAVPYSEAFAEDMQAVAALLETAASRQGEDEAALVAYLKAAAAAFRTNAWEPADEAWAAMNATNSKWYLRIGPDETYFEPCRVKAGFHMTFARIDPGARAWQDRLDPVKSEMEAALAKLAGAPYAAREVSFDLPDFIHIVLNAGDARRPFSATVGQSLPNWGPVANEGRGRTVAMMNVLTAPESIAANERQARSVLCPATAKVFDPDPDALTMSTVLHEAAHNLGPSHEYRVDGKVDDEVFGGALASVLEELKAETASYFFADWLAGRSLITAERARQAHVRDLIWGFGHIARGLKDADGKPKTYSYVAAIQTGYWLDRGVAKWHADAVAANGEDRGCLELDLDAMPKTIEALMAHVAGIKARGDAGAAKALVDKYVESPEGPVIDVVQERWRREPEVSLVYGVQL